MSPVPKFRKESNSRMSDQKPNRDVSTTDTVREDGGIDLMIMMGVIKLV